MNIALLNLIPQKSFANYLGYNQGLGYISAILKKKGHRIHLFNISDEDSKALREMRGFEPDVIFVYLSTNQYRLFVKLLERDLSGLNLPIFAGGPHPTCCPEEVLGLPGVSGVCVGEGDRIVSRILDRVRKEKSFDGIPNLWFKENDEIVRNPTGDFVRDLDRLPFPDREIFPYEDMIKDRSMDIMGFEFSASRGCIYPCRYCINPRLRKLHKGDGYFRRRSIKNLIKEIDEVRKRYNYNGIIGFHDDIFTFDPAWLREFASGYRKTIGLPFWCNSHINNLNEEIVLSLRRAGCFRIHLGIECGNEETRRNLLAKMVSNRNILEKISLLRSHNIKIVTTFMIGLPGEDEEGIKESIEFCREIKPDWVLLSTFCPYPGTSLYEELVGSRRLSPSFYKDLDTDTFYSGRWIYHQGSLSQERLNYYYTNFVRLALGNA